MQHGRERIEQDGPASHGALRPGGCAGDARRHLIHPHLRRPCGCLSASLDITAPRSRGPGTAYPASLGVLHTGDVSSFDTERGRSPKNCHAGSRPVSLSRRQRGYMTCTSRVGDSPRAASKLGLQRGCTVGAGPARRDFLGTQAALDGDRSLAKKVGKAHQGARVTLAQGPGHDLSRLSLATVAQLDRCTVGAGILNAEVILTAVAGSSPAGGFARSRTAASWWMAVDARSARRAAA